MQFVQRLLGGGVIFQSVGCVQFLGHPRFLLIGQMVQHIPPLVDLAALDRHRLTSVLFHRGGQRLATIQNVEPRCDEIEPAFHQVAQQLTNHRRVLRRSLTDA